MATSLMVALMFVTTASAGAQFWKQNGKWVGAGAAGTAHQGTVSANSRQSTREIGAELLLVLTGEAGWDQFGAAVSGVGDVNGDGFVDLMVGAPNHDASGDINAQFGRAYLYYGGPSADAVADLVVTGEARVDMLGVSVAGAGDVNGDGFADVIVNAQRLVSSPRTPRTYVYLGGPAIDDVADLILPGHSSDGAQDVNGDGFADVIIGTINMAEVYYGGPAPDAVPDLTLIGGPPPARGFYYARVAGAGDVNGDGFADLLVGAGTEPSDVDPGRAYVYYGGPGADGIADLTFTGEAAGDGFGFAVAGAGDVNGDGFADLIVGASYDNRAGQWAGRAYVYHGGPGADATADLILTGEMEQDRFGHAVAGAGDVDGDGFDDVIVGGRGARFYLGGPAMDATADVVLTEERRGDGFGLTLGRLGDFDGDGLADVLVGAFNAGESSGPGGRGPGRAYVYGLNVGPDCSHALAHLSELWPPNHKFTPIEVVGVTDPNGDAVTITVTGVTQDEPLAYLRDGSSRPDAILVDGAVSVRSERSGRGNGRVYEIAFTAEDGRGGSCEGTVRVCVPHDRGKRACIDDGQTVNSLGLGDGGGANLQALSMAEAVVSEGEGVEVLGEGRLAGAPVVRSQPVALEFEPIQPNPGTGAVRMRFGLPRASDVRLEVFDVQGRHLTTAVRGVRAAGWHEVAWTGDTDAGRAAGAGLYFMRLRVENRELTQRLVRLP